MGWVLETVSRLFALGDRVVNDWQIAHLLRLVLFATLAVATLALMGCTQNPNDCSHNWVNGLTAGVTP